MSSPHFGEEEPLQRHRVRVQLSSEQTIGPLPAEKPELAANPGQVLQASYFGELRPMLATGCMLSMLQRVSSYGLVGLPKPAQTVTALA